MKKSLKKSAVLTDISLPLECDAVFFDYDGTLFETIPLIMKSYRATYAKYGIEKSDKAIMDSIGVTLEDVFFEDAEGEAALSEELLNYYLDYSAARSEWELGIYLEVPAMLETVASMGIPMAIVTSRRLGHLEKTIAAYGIDHHFQVLTGKHQTVKHKPDPEPILYTMRKMNLSDPSKIVYIGDSVHDVLCAKNAGAVAAIVTWTKMSLTEIKAAGCDLLIDKGVDIKDMILKSNNCKSADCRLNDYRTNDCRTNDFR